MLKRPARQINLLKSLLISCGAEGLKDISSYAIIKLTKFCGVTADHLLRLSDIKRHPNADLADLRLGDGMIAL